MKTAALPRPSVDETIKSISQEFHSLSKQLQTIALYVEKNRNSIGIEGIREFARHCGVQPSAVVRFAKRFGFSGFSDLQSMFRVNLSRQLMPVRNDRSTCTKVIESGNHEWSDWEVAKDFLAEAATGLQELASGVDESAFQRTLHLMSESECIWLVAAGDSFPVATYMEYAMQKTDKRIIAFNTVASMQFGRNHAVRRGDVMVFISYFPYAEETLAVARTAAERGAKLIVITDTRMSALAQLSDVVLVVSDKLTGGFRSLCSAMGLMQSLFFVLMHKPEWSLKPQFTDSNGFQAGRAQSARC